MLRDAEARVLRHYDISYRVSVGERPTRGTGRGHQVRPMWDTISDPCSGNDISFRGSEGMFRSGKESPVKVVIGLLLLGQVLTEAGTEWMRSTGRERMNAPRKKVHTVQRESEELRITLLTSPGTKETSWDGGWPLKDSCRGRVTYWKQKMTHSAALWRTGDGYVHAHRGL